MSQTSRGGLPPQWYSLAIFEPIPRPYSSTQANYVLKELQGYASLRDPVTGIEVWFTPSNIVHRY